MTNLQRDVIPKEAIIIVESKMITIFVENFVGVHGNKYHAVRALDGNGNELLYEIHFGLYLEGENEV